jgi:RNA recognition motif-containing protein
VNLYVVNLSYNVTEDELKSVFSEHGEVSSVKIITDRDSGRPKGFGFVEMSTQEEGDKAIQKLNGKEIQGRAIKVSEARPKRNL